MNRPPVTHAGPDRYVTATAGCIATAQLDGRQSSDPDGNLAGVWWYVGDSDLFVGHGDLVDVRVERAGETKITAKAYDRLGLWSRDEVSIFATLPSSCAEGDE